MANNSPIVSKNVDKSVDSGDNRTYVDKSVRNVEQVSPEMIDGLIMALFLSLPLWALIFWLVSVFV